MTVNRTKLRQYLDSLSKEEAGQIIESIIYTTITFSKSPSSLSYEMEIFLGNHEKAAKEKNLEFISQKEI